MKTSKFLAVILAALLPALGSAGDTYYVYDVLSSAPDGNPLKTNKVRLPAKEGAAYAITPLDGCCERRTLNDMKNCTERLEKFQLNANCGLEKKEYWIKMRLKSNALKVKSSLPLLEIRAQNPLLLWLNSRLILAKS